MSHYAAAAARLLLAGNLTEAQRAAALRKLADRAAVDSGERCPECDCTETEWNGHRGRWAEYRCTDCDHRFGPGAEA